MATSTGSTPLMGLNGPTADDPEGDADTEGSGSAENLNENSLFDSEQSPSSEKEPLSIKRRIALVGALLLCVFTVFAFAFLLPCHKPKCQKVPICPGKGDLTSVNWTSNFSGIIPGLISLVDATGYGRPDVLVQFDIEEKESKNSSFLNHVCKSRNCHGRGVLAIDGSCGNRLWVFSPNSSFGSLACEGLADRTDVNDNHCLLLEEKVKFVLVNVDNGTTKWQSKSPSSQQISSFKFVNDVDGDGVRDIVFIQEQIDDSKGGEVNLLSGKTGKVIGGSLPLPESQSGSNVLAVHNVSSAQQFVIVGSVSFEKDRTSLWAISVHDLLKKVTYPEKKIPGVPWGTHQPDPATGFISILNDSLILVQPLLADLDSDSVKDVVFLIRENGVSLLAVNGNNLTVMWKIVVPSAVSINKLFQAQHSVEGNSSDVALFISHVNHSSALLVFDGQTGKMSWLFHSKIGLPVAPIPVLGINGMKQGFVMWLPKSESLTLIPKPRKSRQIKPDKDGVQENDAISINELVSKKTRKLLSTTGKRMSRRKHHQRAGMNSESNSFTPLEWLYQYPDNIVSSDGHFNEHDDDDDSDVDYEFLDSDEEEVDIAAKEFELGPEQEIMSDDANDLPHALRQLFDTFNENIEADKASFSARKENNPVWQQGDYKEDLYPLTKNKFPDTVYEKDEINDKQMSGEMEDQDADSSNLEQYLNDLTNHKKDELLKTTRKATGNEPVSQDHSLGPHSSPQLSKDDTLKISHKSTGNELVPKDQLVPQSSPEVSKDEVIMTTSKTTRNAPVPRDHFIHQSSAQILKDDILIASHKVTVNAQVPRDKSLHQSSPKAPKDYPPEPTREDEENDFQKTAMSNVTQDGHLMTENDKQENLMVAPAKKPSYHKRSVQTSQSGSQCVRSSSDDADSYVALLLMKDANGKQWIAKITEEIPLYLDAEEYGSLFEAEKCDAKSTSCLRLLPSLVSEPVLRDTEEGVDLVYTVSFVSEDGSHHVAKVRKLTMEQVFQSLKGLKTNVNAGKHKSKRENDYSFSFPRIMKL